MSQRYLEDPAVVSLNKPTGAEGIESLTKYVKDSTGEVRNLLMNECDVIYECRYCRAMFRSIIHFVSHKRSHCRGTHEALSSNAKIAKKAFEDELEKIERENRNKDHSKRNTSLRQRNLVSVLNKRSADVTVPIPGTTELMNLHTLPRVCKQVPVTTFVDGVQKIVDCPASLAHKEGVPSDQVVLVVPHDHTSKYGEMQLRNRRETATKQVISKMTTLKEREALARCQEVVPFAFDVGPNRCRYSGCEEIKSFENILAMAYHIGIKHVIFVESDPKSCLLCDEMFTNVVNYREHLIEKHADVRKAHDSFRANSEIDKKKKKHHREEVSRSRSMSRPPLDADVPVLQAETSKQDYDDSMNGDTDEEPPTLQCELSTDNDSNDVPIRKLRTRPSIESVFARTKRVTRSSSLTRTARTNPSNGVFSNIGDSSAEDGTQSDVSMQKVDRKAENGDIKFEKDINRITRFLIQKADVGQFQASLSEIVSSGEVSLNTSGRNTPHIPLSIVEENDVCNTVNTNVTNESLPDSDDATLAYHKGKMNSSETDKQNQSSSPETDNDNDADSDGRLTVRQRSSRTRKRPEWMSSDYVMSDEKETPPVPPKKNRTTESSPSSRSSPALENVSPQKQLPLIKALSLKKPIMPVRAQIAHRHQSAETKPDIVLPAASPRSSGKATADFQTTVTQYTPRAKKMAADALGITLATPDVPPSPGSSRRKQDMSVVAEKSVKDLANVPVYLSHHQKELFFSGLKQQNGEIAPLSDSKPPKANEGSNGPFVCEHCNETVPNLKDGRRHMVSHIRVMRLRCKLCKAGAFFCTDMRAHLMDRACPKLDMAPTGIVKLGQPCMTKLEADELTEIADTGSPGRVMYTSGEIVSCTSRVPYFPDPIIEEKILGQGRLLAGRNSNGSA